MRYPRTRPITKGSLPHRFFSYLKARELSHTLDLETLSGLDVHILTAEWRIKEEGQRRPFTVEEERACLHVAAQMKFGNWISVER